MSYSSIVVAIFLIIIICNFLSLPIYFLGKISGVKQPVNRFFSLFIGLLIASLIFYLIL